MFLRTLFLLFAVSLPSWGESPDCFTSLSPTSRIVLKEFVLDVAPVIKANDAHTTFKPGGGYETEPVHYAPIRRSFSAVLILLDRPALIALLAGGEEVMRIGLEPHALTKSCAIAQRAAGEFQDDELREYVLATLDKNHEPLFRFVQNYAVPEAAGTDVHTLPRISSITLGQADERMGEAGNLSDGEKKAVLDYTNEDYKLINPALRSGSDFSRLPTLNEKIRLIDSAIARSPKLPGAIRLYRGSRRYPEASDVVGDVVSDKAYSSTSLNPAAAKLFAGDLGVLDIIDLPQTAFAGIYVERISKKAGEFEVILPRGTRFEILDAAHNVRDGQGASLTVRYLRVISHPGNYFSEGK